MSQVLIYTSDYVLDELITLLFRREVFEEATRFVQGILAAAVSVALLVSGAYYFRRMEKTFADVV